MADELTSYLYDHFKMTLTPSQKDAVEALHGPICVISCPGSGKNDCYSDSLSKSNG